MTAARKALEALEAAQKRATKGPWRAVSLGTEAGRKAARGKTRVAGTHPQEGIVTEAAALAQGFQ